MVLPVSRVLCGSLCTLAQLPGSHESVGIYQTSVHCCLMLSRRHVGQQQGRMASPADQSHERASRVAHLHVMTG